MPSVASDPTAILPPVRGSTSARSPGNNTGASPFGDMVDQVATSEPSPQTARPSRRTSSDRADSNRTIDRPRNTDKPERTERADRADKTAKSSSDKTADSKPDDTTKAAMDSATTTETTVAVAEPVVTEDDQAAQMFAAAVDHATQVEDSETNQSDDKTDVVGAKDGKTAEKPDTAKTDAAPVDPATTTNTAQPQAKPADAAVVATTIAPQAETVIAPKTSVPQVPRIAAPGTAKHIATVQKHADAATTKSTEADDGDAAEELKAGKADGDATNADSPDQAPVVRRAEHFSAKLETEATRSRTEPAASTKLDAPQITLPPALTQQLAANAPAPMQTQAAVSADASKPVPLDGVAIQIATKAGEGSRHFEIRLDPPELGRIEVRLEVDKSGQVVSHITADRGDTLDLLRRDSSNLERALQDAGLKTGDNGMQFSLRDQGFADNNRQQTNTDTAQIVVSDDSTPFLTPRDYRAYGTRAGGVDIRV